MATLAGPPDRLAAVAVSANGRTVAAGGAGGVVRVWDTDGPEPVLTLRVCRHDLGPARPQAVVSGGAPALAVAPDGRLLAVGAGEGEAVLWDWVTAARSAGSPGTPVT